MDRGVKQLISQALESKAKAFHTRIEGVVQNYMYMQSHPQRQDKHLRKYKTVDTKEEAKPSTSEVISDISQLIPVPSSSGTILLLVTAKAEVDQTCRSLQGFLVDFALGYHPV